MSTANHTPSRVCILTEFAAKRFEFRDLANYRCKGGKHIHLKRELALLLVEAGTHAWVSNGERMLKHLGPKHWVISQSAGHSGTVTNLQMKRGGLTLPARKLQGGLISPR